MLLYTKSYKFTYISSCIFVVCFILSFVFGFHFFFFQSYLRSKIQFMYRPDAYHDKTKQRCESILNIQLINFEFSVQNSLTSKNKWNNMAMCEYGVFMCMWHSVCDTNTIRSNWNWNRNERKVKKSEIFCVVRLCAQACSHERDSFPLGVFSFVYITNFGLLSINLQWAKIIKSLTFL